MSVERTYRVTGRVQGVGFRYFVARLGRAEGVHGGVRNEMDGAVTARVSAEDEAALERFRAGLERGPSAARVDAVREDSAEDGPFDLSF